jgi:lipopolysaccharide/colanic/teichoic acid biosynthesis glycosyltransferase
MGTRTLDPPDLPTAATSTQIRERGRDVACRVLDIVAASLGLLVLSPLLVLITLTVRLESPGPAIFRQRRVGLGLRPFTLHKFRTMKYGAGNDVHRAFVRALIAGDTPVEAEGKPSFKLPSDDRITRVGKFLRKTSLDELPQLWNVVRGEMSLVGPRPPIPYEVEQYPSHWFPRFRVKPGVTGLWQVSGRSRVTLEEMVKLDIEYVHRRSLWLNLRILVLTVPAVVSGRGAS